jgi:hypothetical protein
MSSCWISGHRTLGGRLPPPPPIVNEADDDEDNASSGVEDEESVPTMSLDSYVAELCRCMTSGSHVPSEEKEAVKD